VLTLLGAATLFGSLFLVWSHQLNRAELAHFRGAALYGVAADPTAFQVYAVAGVVLALLAVGIAVAGLWGQRPVSAAVLVAAAVGLAFVIRAAGSAPTNGLLLVPPRDATAVYFRDPATAGVGETLAIVGLGLALMGLLGVTMIPARRPEPRTRAAAGS
jgi:hypothetical protein